MRPPLTDRQTETVVALDDEVHVCSKRGERKGESLLRPLPLSGLSPLQRKTHVGKEEKEERVQTLISPQIPERKGGQKEYGKFVLCKSSRIFSFYTMSDTVPSAIWGNPYLSKFQLILFWNHRRFKGRASNHTANTQSEKVHSSVCWEVVGRFSATGLAAAPRNWRPHPAFPPPSSVIKIPIVKGTCLYAAYVAMWSRSLSLPLRP